MTEDQAYRIREWIEVPKQVRDDGMPAMDDGAYFELGLVLLGEVMPNLFFLANIRRKGTVRGLETVKFELGQKIRGFKWQDRRRETGDGRRETGDNSGLPPATFLAVRNDAGVASASPRNDGSGKRFVLREEFPFLVRDDCPEEFKVLVADMITAHDRYVNAHPKTFAVANKDNEACFAVARVLVENYLNNRKCWNELEHYKKTGEILGEHELFAKRTRENELKEMPATELMALYRNLPRNIRYYGKLIEDDPDNELTADRMKKKECFEWELKVVKRLMDVREKKKVVSRSKQLKNKEVGKKKIINDYMTKLEEKTENSAKVSWRPEK